MKHRFQYLLAAVTLALGTVAQAVPINPLHLPLKSGGKPDGNAWTLETPGYLATYIRLAQPAAVTVRVYAEVRAHRQKPPRIVIAAGSQRFPHRVPADKAPISQAVDLPAGTHLLRIEVPIGGGLTFTSVEVQGAEPLEGNRPEYALAAAETFIATGRKSATTLRVPSLAPGTPVHVRQVRPAFHWGANASGATNVLLQKNQPPESDPARFQAFFRQHFNAVVPSNAGKWAYNEPQPGVPTMDYIDAILDFARENTMHARMHALVWDTRQQPQWVLDLLDRADKGDAAAKAELRQAITRRIGYYVKDLAARYHELDVLNESLHEGRYLRIFGLDGIAGIFKEVAEALPSPPGQPPAGGPPALRTFINEYNVIQYSQRPPFGRAGESDPYANWYREHAEDLLARGGQLSGIGIQYYVDPRPEVRDPHSPEKVMQVLTNLAVTGLSLTLTEFGIKAGGTLESNAKLLTDCMRLAYGHPDTTGFFLFGFWSKAMWNQAPGAVLADETFQLTALGQAYAALRKEWTTELEATVTEASTLPLTGFHGDYELLAGGKTLRFSITPGNSDITARE